VTALKTLAGAVASANMWNPWLNVSDFVAFEQVIFSLLSVYFFMKWMQVKGGNMPESLEYTAENSTNMSF